MGIWEWHFLVVLKFELICTILTFQYLTKAAFSFLKIIKVTFLILHHFPVLLLPLCLPVVLCREPARPRSAEDPEDMSPFWARSYGAGEPWLSTTGSYNREPRRENDAK